MFTGASNAHVAILLVDARAGVLRQTRTTRPDRKTVGHQALRRDGEQDRPDRLRPGPVRRGRRRSSSRWPPRLGGAELTVIPIAAKHGDNVVHRSDNTPWYDGPTLLEYLEGIELSAPQPEPTKLRLPIQWVSRPDRRRAPPLHRTTRRGHPERRRPDRVAARGHPVDGDRRRHPRRRPRRRPLRRCRFRSNWPTTSTSAAATCSSAAPTTPRCRCWPANSTRRCAGSPRPRCGPATGWRSSRPPRRCGPRCRPCTPGWIPRRSTSSTTQSSWRSTTSAR